MIGERWIRAWLLASVAVLGCFEGNDGDLGFHLATGREILRTGRIPARNVLSFSEPEHVWLLHQALPAVAFEWLWQHGGAYALMALKLSLLVGTWAFMYAAARALSVAPLVAAGACLAAVCVSAFRFELRPYLFTHLTLAAVVWILAMLAAGRTSPRRLQLSTAAALGIGCQLHAGALDSVVVLLAFGLGSLVEARRSSNRRAQLRAAAVCLSAVTYGLAAAALLLAAYHPLGPRVLLFPFEMATHSYWGEHLVEFRHAWRLPARLLWAYWGWLLLFVIVVTVHGRRIHPGLCAIGVVYALLSLWYVRMVYAFAIVSLPIVAVGAQTFVKRPSAGFRTVLAMTLASLLAAAYVYRDHAFGMGVSEATWPRGHFRFLREHGVRGRAFVSDAWAGPFLGAFYPERLSFFDDRLEAYSDHMAREVYQTIRYGAPGWDAWLDHYRVEYLVLRYSTPGEAQRGWRGETLRQRLVRDKRYALVFFDDVGELFVRKQGENAALALTHAIEGVDPDLHQFLTRPALTAPSLVRAADSGMRSSTLLGLTALALADAGDRARARAVATALRDTAPDDAFTRVVLARVPPPDAP